MGAIVAGLWPDHDRPEDGAKITAVVVAGLAWLFAEFSGIAKPSDHDLALFERFRSTLQERERSLLRDHDFDNSFSSNETEGLREIASWAGVAYEFSDPKIEADWVLVLKKVGAFLTMVAKHTGPVRTTADRFSVHPPNLDPMQPQAQISSAIVELNATASALSTQLENFERMTRRRLGL